MAKFSLLKVEGKARRGRFETVHGTIETPVFMNVGTSAAIKGGISTKEVNAKTMMSKLVQNLYFAGEILDVDAYTGGYNLQIAFSTGALAGKYASQTEEQL